LKKIITLLLLLFPFLFCYSQQNKLQYYLDNALQNSPLINDYKNQLQINTFDSLLIRAGLKPQVNFTSTNSYAPVIKGYGYDGAITNGTNISALFGVNKQFVNKKNLGAQLDNLNLISRSIYNNVKITEQDLKRSIINQYISAYGTLLQVNFGNEIKSLLSKEEIILKKLTQGNVYKQSDYLSFLVTLQQQDFTVQQSNAQYKNDIALLNYITGIVDTATVILNEPDISLPSVIDSSAQVYLQQYNIDSLKFVNSKRLADINYRPKIGISADAGYYSSLAVMPYKNFGTSVGVNVLVPIYDGKQKKLQYSKIDLQEKTRQTNKTFFLNQYRQQTMQYLQQLNAADAIINNINAQLKYTQTLIEVNEKLLAAGEIKITDYVLALNNYINAKNLITQNKINKLQLINQLNYRTK
jgi:outer membrane protein TolC